MMMTPPMTVSPEMIDKVVRDLPRMARLALGFAAKLTRGTLTVQLPDGRSLLFGGAEPGPHAIMIIKDLGFARRVITSGDLGIAEAYLRGEWESPNLTQFLHLFCANSELTETMLDGRPLMRLWQNCQHWLNRNTRRQARRNIEAHYDLGNAFYSAWLDASMTYSSALFEGGINSLECAQRAKYRHIADELALSPGQSVLEIGCGWGGFAEYAAAERGCRVVGLTISREQFDYATQRMAAAGLSDKVSIRLQDYRDERGSYDRIVSIEMIEAVGESFWPTYFRQLRDRLAPGGLAGIQTITIQDRFFDAYHRNLDFIRGYVFPGGMLPTPSILKTLGDRTGLALVGEREFGLDYATTLVHWRDRFRAAWPTLVPLGFDERFRRLWEYYLAYCEAGFRARNIDVRQMIFARAG
ncbi:Cyclopropane-fatty-acyl-phospholipid synthase [Blastochloris viridis]|uniref:Cyclopropane-fatty-acyl-phospholipid synthase n=2 Tax=Blastochloris viridis TaxID=1079 RepID=A0A0H5BGC0_BLAVI|nr:Cyclopropane-fatty-acyl-phospholipid synthase [Blastochloris viridis]BAS00185.1 cyclopropane-fatty-acyl-phospholipid synthase [Blastochloris viridis]CUU42571.1 Cyclopropane-fatty-acyl-phospholipid synthase [Blastochloris viridis]